MCLGLTNTYCTSTMMLMVSLMIGTVAIILPIISVVDGTSDATAFIESSSSLLSFHNSKQQKQQQQNQKYIGQSSLPFVTERTTVQVPSFVSLGQLSLSKWNDLYTSNNYNSGGRYYYSSNHLNNDNSHHQLNLHSSSTTIQQSEQSFVSNRYNNPFDDTIQSKQRRQQLHITNTVPVDDTTKQQQQQKGGGHYDKQYQNRNERKKIHLDAHQSTSVRPREYTGKQSLDIYGTKQQLYQREDNTHHQQHPNDYFTTTDYDSYFQPSTSLSSSSFLQNSNTNTILDDTKTKMLMNRPNSITEDNNIAFTTTNTNYDQLIQKLDDSYERLLKKVSAVTGEDTITIDKQIIDKVRNNNNNNRNTIRSVQSIPRSNIDKKQHVDSRAGTRTSTSSSSSSTAESLTDSKRNNQNSSVDQSRPFVTNDAHYQQSASQQQHQQHQQDQYYDTNEKRKTRPSQYEQWFGHYNINTQDNNNNGNNLYNTNERYTRIVEEVSERIENPFQNFNDKVRREQQQDQQQQRRREINTNNGNYQHQDFEQQPNYDSVYGNENSRDTHNNFPFMNTVTTQSHQAKPTTQRQPSTELLVVEEYDMDNNRNRNNNPFGTATRDATAIAVQETSSEQQLQHKFQSTPNFVELLDMNNSRNRNNNPFSVNSNNGRFASRILQQQQVQQQQQQQQLDKYEVDPKQRSSYYSSGNIDDNDHSKMFSILQNRYANPFQGTEHRTVPYYQQRTEHTGQQQIQKDDDTALLQVVTSIDNEQLDKINEKEYQTVPLINTGSSQHKHDDVDDDENTKLTLDTESELGSDVTIMQKGTTSSDNDRKRLQIGFQDSRNRPTNVIVDRNNNYSTLNRKSNTVSRTDSSIATYNKMDVSVAKSNTSSMSVLQQKLLVNTSHSDGKAKQDKQQHFEIEQLKEDSPVAVKKETVVAATYTDEKQTTSNDNESAKTPTKHPINNVVMTGTDNGLQVEQEDDRIAKGIAVPSPVNVVVPNNQAIADNIEKEKRNLIDYFTEVSDLMNIVTLQESAASTNITEKVTIPDVAKTTNKTTGVSIIDDLVRSLTQLSQHNAKLQAELDKVHNQINAMSKTFEERLEATEQNIIRNNVSSQELFDQVQKQRLDDFGIFQQQQKQLQQEIVTKLDRQEQERVRIYSEQQKQRDELAAKQYQQIRQLIAEIVASNK